MAGRPPEPDDEREPTPDADDIDVRFADITASLGDITVPPDEGDDVASARAGPEDQAPRPLPGPRDHVLPEVDDDARFAPPEPPPLAGGDPLLVLAWSGVCVPVGLVLVYLVGWRSMPGFLLGLAGIMFVISVGILVWRMPGRRDPDDSDDGAVV
jgi:hypothetical protein